MTFFKIGYCDFWKKLIHKIINETKSKFPGLSWLRVSMSYHQFCNVHQLLQEDLGTKLSKNLQSLDFATLPCNCPKNTKCIYGGKCRTSIVVYKAICEKTGKAYIGNTQQFVKKRMQQHVQDVRRLVISDKSSDSFAAHFANLVPSNIKNKAIKDLLEFKVEIIWKGNPMSCVKTFGTRMCKLCAKERMAIVKMCKLSPTKIINKCNEVYGACRHKPRFHRFEQHSTAGTDESKKGRKGNKSSPSKSSRKKKKKKKATERPNSVTPPSSPNSTDGNSVSSEVGKHFLIGKMCLECK